MSRNPIRQLALALLLLLIGAISAQANVVTSAADDGSPGTLRSVIAAAAPNDTITFDPSLSGQTITLTQGQLVLDKDLTISGPGADQIEISGGGAGRVFLIPSATIPHAVTLSGITLSNGAVIETYDFPFRGGAILNRGNLTLQNCTLANNSSWDGGNALRNEGGLTVEGCTFANNYQDGSRGSIGGAISNGSPSPVTITNSLFSGNSAYSAGAIFNEYTAGTMHITGTTFKGNTVTYIGGGVYNEGGAVTIENSTFSGNAATGTPQGSYGGGIYATNSSTVNVLFCTFARNSAGYGAGVYSASSVVNVKNSLFSGSVGSDCDGGWVNAFGVNLHTGTVFTSGFTKVTEAALNLQPLASNGGPTQTHAFGFPSVAMNAAPDDTDFDGFPVTVDQRGETRSIGWRADVGAFEEQNPPPDTVAPTIQWGDRTPAPNAAGWNNTSVSFPFTVTDNDSGVASVSTDSPVTFALEGANQTQDVTVTDNANNSATITSPVVKIDKTAPVSSHSVSGSSVTLSATDNLSGVKAIYYRVDGGLQQTYLNAPFTLTDSQNSVQYWSVDNADNVESAHTLTLDNDTTPPVVVFGTLSPTPNADGWNNTAVELPFTVTDDRSGVAPSSPAGPLTFALEGANQTQDVTVTDNAGNSKTFTSPAVNIDWTAPTTTGSAAGTTTSTVTLSASDSLSGVKATYYRVDGGAQQTYTAPFTLPQGFYSVQYWSLDKAGNPEEAKWLDIDTRFAVTVVVANVSGRRGKNVTLSATVTQTNNRAKLSGKAVTFLVDGQFVGNAVTNKQGVASVSYAISANAALGAHSISAIAQPGTHQSGFGTGTLTVNR